MPVTDQQRLQRPKIMKAAAADELGPPDVVHLEDVPVPRLGPDEVMVRVDVAGVGEWDPSLVAGEFSVGPRRFPRVYGSDGAGVVVAVGARVRKLKPGDGVFGYGFGNTKGGFFAEYTVVKADNVARIPKDLSVDEAGVLAVSGITGLEGLEAMRVKAGDTVLIVGASGGVGHVALQLAKRKGARVFAIASGDDGVSLAHGLGADEVVDGKHDDVIAEAAEFCDGESCFDSALVLTGGDDGWQDLLALVRRGGIVAHPNGVEPTPKAPPGVKVTSYNGVPSPAAFRRLAQLVEKGPFHVVVSRTFPLEKAADALRAVTKHHLGKIALRVH